MVLGYTPIFHHWCEPWTVAEKNGDSNPRYSTPIDLWFCLQHSVVNSFKNETFNQKIKLSNLFSSRFAASFVEELPNAAVFESATGSSRSTVKALSQFHTKRLSISWPRPSGRWEFIILRKPELCVLVKKNKNLKFFGTLTSFQFHFLVWLGYGILRLLYVVKARLLKLFLMDL